MKALFIVAALCTTLTLRAQAVDPPQAPLPAGIAQSTVLFLGNAGDQENADCLRAYNVFYAGLKALGKYKLVDYPSNAQLILELHYEVALGQAIASNDTNKSVRQFRLVLLDPQAHAVLWSLTERTNYALRQGNRNKNLDETVAKLLNDFTSLTASQPPNNDSRVKHPHFP